MQGSSATTTVSISRLYNLNLQTNQTILINLTISGASDLASCRLHLAWDPNIVKVTTGDPNGWMDPFTGIQYGVYEGPFLKGFSNSTMFLVNKINNVAGNMSGLYNAIVAGGIAASGSGVFAAINFTCVSPGNTAIRIIGPMNGTSSVQNREGTQIPHVDVDGLITTEPPPPIWTEFWFQATAGFTLIEILIIVLIIFTIVKWWRRSLAEAESEKVEDLFLS
jgi:hypothetical protein